MIPNPIWNKPSRNIVSSLILGSGLPLGDKGGWELEKSLLSIAFLSDRLLNLIFYFFSISI
jgi:hypothetical protein